MNKKVNNTNFLKIIIILFFGLLLGYLMVNRTILPIYLRVVCDDGLFIVLGITIIAALTKEKNKIGINITVFGGSVAFVVSWIQNIKLFLDIGEQNYNYILKGLCDFILITGFAFIIGKILAQYQEMNGLSIISSSLPAMYCAFTLCSYGVGKEMLFGAWINILILIAVFFLMGKKYIKQRIIIVILTLLFGYLYFV